jgi:hypothetical protein
LSNGRPGALKRRSEKRKRDEYMWKVAFEIDSNTGRQKEQRVVRIVRLFTDEMGKSLKRGLLRPWHARKGHQGTQERRDACLRMGMRGVRKRRLTWILNWVITLLLIDRKKVNAKIYVRPPELVFFRNFKSGDT